MRPRLLRRGDTEGSAKNSGVVTGFNEAAAVTPRRCMERIRDIIREAGFNEAAAVTPRRFDTMSPITPEVIVLQ